ncbi:alpha-1,6-mannosyl-glycoprotein 2-beta-N-acetylglucosaminyltransferase [Planococcus citri]|uniref:alpha-1,6-mannosyl-glycoprotein 2-beta-N-acetylglucosaminyltransferase n=1 Tax=Planococcus citri TaxID=170843 RepID=UPI0031FA24AE
MSKINVICRRNLLYRFHNGLLVILLMSFWLMFHILSFNTFNKQAQRDAVDENVNLSNAIILSMVPQAYHKYLVSKIKNTTSPSRAATNVSSSKTPFQQVLSINEIQRRIDEYNKLQTVLNEDIFGPLQNDSLVIVIQVHNRLMYLRHTIISLAQAEGIENALLVFSHDYYDEEINSIIQSIDFCKVMQIFYPYSIQTHPNEFPGESKNDCPRNINIKEAVERKCTNALHPDLYGHYREAKFTQTKHHWWWKANRVFNGLNITKNYTGLVVFFEEDHYVAQDFIHMLHLMEHARQSACPNCKILSLGSYLKSVDFAADSKKAEIMQWSSSKHNMGMAFNRSVWKELKSCAKTFCTYDDYNWDWSLLAVSSKCLSKELTAMVLRAPRVFHIGECGVHHKNSCKSTQTLRRVQKLLVTSTAYLYPQDLYLTYTVTKKYLKKAKGNGGWGDIRDHNLCLKMVDRSR